MSSKYGLRYNGFLEVAEKRRKEKNNIIFFFLGSLIVFTYYLIFSLRLEGKCHVVSLEACTWLRPFPSSVSVNPLSKNQGVRGFQGNQVQRKTS